jgi:hypothetical protein
VELVFAAARIERGFSEEVAPPYFVSDER